MKPYCINIQNCIYEWRSPKLMGILNVTSDSFSEASHLLPSGGMAAADEKALEEAILTSARKHLEAGADILDIGGCSTRPGAPDIAPEEEEARVCFAIRAIRREWPSAVLSVDTFRSPVAKAAVAAGADMINDISGGQTDAGMFPLVGQLQVPYILSHTRGTPATMQQLTDYGDLMTELLRYFSEKISSLQRLGVKDIILDPGFGFAKTTEQNYELLRRMNELEIFGRPILAGLSRKSMICKPLDITPQEALNGTTALHMMALMNGASILRVHDVREARETIRLYEMACPAKA